MSDQNLKTSLHNWHAENGGRMVDFAGWQMPIQYGSIIDEHNATRNSATLFDVSHMGRIYLSGENVDQFVDGLTTRKVAGMGEGRIRYSLLCNEQGGILDDILVYNLPGQPEFMLVVNASNRDKINSWLAERLSTVQVESNDRTLETSMIALQGPQALDVLQQTLGIDLRDLKYFQCRRVSVAGTDVLMSRTGYTGEDGCEMIGDHDSTVAIWEQLVSRDEVSPAGLGARDTLRLEAAMPLYGHELSETMNAAQTDLGFALSLKDREFVGKSSIEGALSDQSLHGRIGLILDGKRAAREGAEILAGEEVVGKVTSGTFSPTLQKPIAMGYVQPDCSAAGTELMVDIRGKQISATVTELPFYKR